MKKPKKVISLKQPPEQNTVVHEPEAIYETMPTQQRMKTLHYNDFLKVANTVPFSMAEWATVLHLSERTLQRYAKNNTEFAPIHAERFLQIKKILLQGEDVFGTTTKFCNWLNNNPYMLEGQLSFTMLASYDGIQLIQTQLGRLEHGILA